MSEENGRGWYLVLGILLIVLGIAAIAAPMAAGIAAELVFGGVLLVAGILRLVYAYQSRRWRRTGGEMAIAAVYIVGGLLLLAFPVVGLFSLTLVLALVFVLGGLAELWLGAQARGVPGRGWAIFGGLLSIGLGVLIWAEWPATALWAIGLLVGIEILFTGLTMVLAGSISTPTGPRVVARG